MQVRSSNDDDDDVAPQSRRPDKENPQPTNFKYFPVLCATTRVAPCHVMGLFFPSVIQFVFLSNGRLPRQWGFFIADCLIVKHPIVWRSQSHTCCWHPCRAPPIQSTRLPIPCLHRRLHTLPVKGRTVYANSHTKIKFVRDYYHSIPKESQ